ncbi:MAG: hypothetical protein PHU12_01945 [Candidatus Aenigmarchaeota archaeon]|nr:hypothetical protein [Candidatus Aenigmarchaeota archaeon]
MKEKYDILPSKKYSDKFKDIAIKLYYYASSIVSGALVAKAFYDVIIERSPEMAFDDAKAASIVFFPAYAAKNRHDSTVNAKKEWKNISDELQKSGVDIDLEKTYESALKETDPWDIVRSKPVKALRKFKDAIVERDFAVRGAKKKLRRFNVEVDISKKAQDFIVDSKDAYETLKAQAETSRYIENNIDRFASIEESDPTCNNIIKYLTVESVRECIDKIFGIENSHGPVDSIEKLAVKLPLDPEKVRKAENCISTWEETGEIPDISAFTN